MPIETDIRDWVAGLPDDVAAEAIELQLEAWATTSGHPMIPHWVTAAWRRRWPGGGGPLHVELLPFEWEVAVATAAVGDAAGDRARARAVARRDDLVARRAAFTRIAVEGWTVVSAKGNVVVARVVERIRDGVRTPEPELFKLASFTQHTASYGPGGIGLAWFDSPFRRERLLGLDFCPTEDEAERLGVFNLWHGWGVEPVEGGCGLILDHLHRIVCRGHEGHFESLLDLLAWKVQHPLDPPGVVLVLIGPEGTGKTLVSLLMRRLFGGHGFEVQKESQLVGRFNFHLADKLVVGVEELFAGSPKAAAEFKAMATSPTLTIEPKGVNAWQAVNRALYIWTTNAKHGANIGSTSDGGGQGRRFFVLDVDPEYADTGDPEQGAKRKLYFDPLFAQIDGGGGGAFLHLLLNRVLPAGYRPSRPVTDALLDQRHRSLTGTAAWLADVLAEGSFGRAVRLKSAAKVVAAADARKRKVVSDLAPDVDLRGNWCIEEVLVERHHLRPLFNDWLEERRNHHRAGVGGLMGYGDVAEMLGGKEDRRRLDSGDRDATRLLRLPPLDEARAAFFRVTGVKIEDDDNRLKEELP